MASSITIECLKTIIRNKNSLNIWIIIIFFIQCIFYKNAQNRTIFIFLHAIHLDRMRQFRRHANFAVSPLQFSKQNPRV